MNSSKIKKNAVVTTAIASADGLPKFIGVLSASISPANTDERVAATLYELNEAGLLPGSLRDFLQGPLRVQGLQPGEQPYGDFFTVLLLDKGKIMLIRGHYSSFSEVYLYLQKKFCFSRSKIES